MCQNNHIFCTMYTHLYALDQLQNTERALQVRNREFVVSRCLVSPNLTLY